MTRTLVSEFHDWDYSSPVSIECPRHPENKYVWKGPGRNIHMVGTGLVEECPCKISDCVVLTDGEPWTTSVKQDIGTYNLQHSGPAFKFSLTRYGYLIAVFEELSDLIEYVNMKREFKGFDPMGAESDGYEVEPI